MTQTIHVMRLPHAEGLEVYPTIEIINRTYAPVDQQVRFAIPVEIAQDDRNDRRHERAGQGDDNAQTRQILRVWTRHDHDTDKAQHDGAPAMDADMLAQDHGGEDRREDGHGEGDGRGLG